MPNLIVEVDVKIEDFKKGIEYSQLLVNYIIISSKNSKLISLKCLVHN